MEFDDTTVSKTKTNEQNILILKNSLDELKDELIYQLGQLELRIAKLEKENDDGK